MAPFLTAVRGPPFPAPLRGARCFCCALASHDVPTLTYGDVRFDQTLCLFSPDTVECLTKEITIEAGASQYISFRFKPTKLNFHMYVFVNDTNGKTEECFAVHVSVSRDRDPDAPKVQLGSTQAWETIA